MGPRTVKTDMEALRRKGLTTQTSTSSWTESAGIPRGDRSIHEYDILGEILFALLCIDQCNISNLVGAEIACRRRSVIVEAHAISPANPDYSAADEMMGLGGRRGSVGVSPALQTYTAGRLRDQAAILKEKRKSAEETRLKKTAQTGKHGQGGAT